MRRVRRIYCICYALMIMGLVALYLQPSPLPELTPREKWSNFQEWLGPAPLKLIAEDWSTDKDVYTGVTFVFLASEDWREEIIGRFSMVEGRRNTSPLQPHWQDSLAPESPLLTARRQSLLTGKGEPTYDVKDMTLARLRDGRTLLAFRHRWDNTFGKNSYIAPAYEPGQGRDFPVWYVVLYGGAAVAFILLVPLGFLLLFPCFDLTRRGHTFLWFATALFYPIGVAMLTLPFIYSGSEALIAFIAIIFILEPLQLIGAGILFTLARIALARRSSRLNPSCAE